MNDISEATDIPEQDSSEQQLEGSFKTNEFQEFLPTDNEVSELSKSNSEKIIKESLNEESKLEDDIANAISKKEDSEKDEVHSLITDGTDESDEGVADNFSETPIYLTNNFLNNYSKAYSQSGGVPELAEKEPLGEDPTGIPFKVHPIEDDDGTAITELQLNKVAAAEGFNNSPKKIDERWNSLIKFIKDDKQEELIDEGRKEQEANEEKAEKVNASNLTSEENNSEMMTDRKLWIPITNDETDFDYTKTSEKESIFRPTNVRSILKTKGRQGVDEARRNSKKKLSSKQAHPAGLNANEFIKRGSSKKPSSINNILSFLGKKSPTQVVPENPSGSSQLNFTFLKVASAIAKFKSLIKYKRFQNLNLNQFKMISDVSYYNENRNSEEIKEATKTSWIGRKLACFWINLILLTREANSLICPDSLSRCKEALLSRTRKISLINPKARWKMTWDLVNMIIIFWNFMIISIAICFGRPTENVFLLKDNSNDRDMYYVFLIFSFFNMTIDIAFTLNTQFYEMGVFVKDRKKIFNNYLRENLVIDLVAGIPFFFQILSYHAPLDRDFVKYFNCLFFVKYYNIQGVFKILEEILSLDDKYEAFFSLLKLFIKIFFVAHIMACLWHSAAYFGRTPDDRTWLQKRNLSEETAWTERYIYSIYFALMTMTTVGYGDISAENQREALAAMISMLVGSLMFGYSINSIGELLKKMNKKQDELKKDVTLLDRFMKSKKIEYELQARARKYLEFVWHEEKMAHNENSDEILEKLSSNIREEVLLQSHGRFLLNYPMLFKNFSEKTMRRLVNVIKPVRFSPEEIIFDEGETSLNPNLYMIAHGEIEICLPILNGEEEICRLKLLRGGDSFGEVSFFTELPQEYTARSLNYSTVYLLDKREFLAIISENNDEEDYEKFCMIRDKILLYEEYDQLSLKCYSCNDNHIIKKCPAIQYIPRIRKIILMHQNKIKRIKTHRGELKKPRRKKSVNSLLIIKMSQTKAKPFHTNGFVISPELDELDAAPSTKIEILGADRQIKVLDLKTKEEGANYGDGLSKTGVNPAFVSRRTSFAQGLKISDSKRRKSRLKDEEQEILNPIDASSKPNNQPFLMRRQSLAQSPLKLTDHLRRRSRMREEDQEDNMHTNMHPNEGSLKTIPVAQPFSIRRQSIAQSPLKLTDNLRRKSRMREEEPEENIHASDGSSKTLSVSPPSLLRRPSVAQSLFKLNDNKRRKSRMKEDETLIANRRESSDFKNQRSLTNQAPEVIDEDHTKYPADKNYNYGFQSKSIEEDLPINNNELFMMNFDYYKNYDNYFVQNNPENVILKMALKFKEKTKYLVKKRGAISFGNDLVEVSSPKKSRSILLKRLSSKKSFFQNYFMN